jgi:hypothetical protein
MLGLARLRIHIVLAHLAVVFTVALLMGAIGAILRVARVWRNGKDCVEIALMVLSAGYVFIMLYYGIWHAIETDGPVKAAYGMGAGTLLSLWTARPLAALLRYRFARVPVGLLVAAPAALAVAQRIYW